MWMYTYLRSFEMKKLCGETGCQSNVHQHCQGVLSHMSVSPLEALFEQLLF